MTVFAVSLSSACRPRANCGEELSSSPVGARQVEEHDLPVPPALLVGRVVAVGIPGASAISAVGTFHVGGPLHDNPEFAAFTAPGKVLSRPALFSAYRPGLSEALC